MAKTRRSNLNGTEPSSVPKSWNVLTTPWLEVTDSKARLKRVSVLDAMRDSAAIHRVAAASPLDLFAIHRFLITLLYWQAESCGGVEKLRNSLLVGRIPRGLLEGLSDAAEHFELFDAKRPFLQDPSVKDADRLSAASLFSEMATGTNVAHFHHGDDEAARLCLPCATRGLLRLVPWTQSGGAGKQPALHGAPPIMPLAMGVTLCETLGLNLVSPIANMGAPRWSGQFKPSGRKSGVPLLEGLTWNPRRVHLGEPSPRGVCTLCGSTAGPVVGPIVFSKNPACKNEAATETESWRDPAAFYRDRDGLIIRTSNEADASLRDDIRRLFEQRFGKKLEAAPVSQSSPYARG